MLWALLKLGVSNPAGASVGAAAGGGAWAPANRAPQTVNVATRQEQTRIFFERGISITP
jgi:hypothetical protein